jgi:hypothetical protein
MRQKLVYGRNDLQAPRLLLDTVLWPAPDKVERFFAAQKSKLRQSSQ